MNSVRAKGEKKNYAILYVTTVSSQGKNLVLYTQSIITIYIQNFYNELFTYVIQ
jgi:hypothetical protein